MGKRSQRKGAVGEREAAKAVAETFGAKAHRGRQYHGGPDAPDIKTTLPGVHWEVKRCEALRIYPAMEQAIEDAGDDVPVVLHRRNNREWLLVMRLEDAPRFAGRAHDHS